MKLYTGPLSLFSHKVEIALREKGLKYERETVAFTQTEGYRPKHPAVLAANPKGQVPVLIDHALTLYDSTVILEYIEDAYPTPHLFPRTLKNRALCRQIELFADEVMLVPLRTLMHRTEPRPADGSDAARWSEKEAKALASFSSQNQNFASLEEHLAGQDYLCGRDLSVADIAVFMVLLYNNRLAGPEFAQFRALSAWYDRQRKRESFAQAIREIAQADARLSAPVVGARA